MKKIKKNVKKGKKQCLEKVWLLEFFVGIE